MDAMLGDLRRAWAGEPLAEGTRLVAPDPGPAGVPLLIGGHTDAAVRRTVKYGAGWTAGGLPPELVAPLLDRVRAAWSDAGREGAPRLVALAYFSLGDTEQGSRDYVLDYYAPMGDVARMVAGSVLRSPYALRGAVSAFRDIGIDELVLDPTVANPAQVDLLAEAVL